jgi:hypothetical protein
MTTIFSLRRKITTIRHMLDCTVIERNATSPINN